MAFVTPVVEHWLENKITQWVHIKVREDDRTCYFARPLVINKNIARLKAPMWYDFRVMEVNHAVTNIFENREAKIII